MRLDKSVGLTLVANNGMMGIERDVPYKYDDEASIDPEGFDWDSFEVCLPYTPFQKAVSGMAGEVIVTLDEKRCRLQVVGGNGFVGDVEIRTIPNGPVYPPIKMLDSRFLVTKASQFIKATTMARQACSGLPGDTIRNAVHLRPHFNGEDYWLVAEAANGQHAARVTIVGSADGEEVNMGVAINIPSGHLNAIKGFSGTMVLSTDGQDKVAIHAGASRWMSLLFEGKWPDLDRIMSGTTPECVFSISRQALMERTKQAAAFGATTTTANEKYSRVRYVVDPEEGMLSIEGDDSVYGKYQWKLPITLVDDPVATFNMDARQMLAALAGIDSEMVEVQLHGRLIHLLGEDQIHLLSTVMI